MKKWVKIFTFAYGQGCVKKTNIRNGFLTLLQMGNLVLVQLVLPGSGVPWQCLNFITLVVSFLLTTDIPQNSHPPYLKRPKNEAEFCFVLRDLHSRIEILRRGVVCHMAPPLLFISTASHRSSSSSIITDQSHKCLWSRVSQKNQKSEFCFATKPTGFHRLDEPPEKISALQTHKRHSASNFQFYIVITMGKSAKNLIWS